MFHLFFLVLPLKKIRYSIYKPHQKPTAEEKFIYFLLLGELLFFSIIRIAPPILFTILITERCHIVGDPTCIYIYKYVSPD